MHSLSRPHGSLCNQLMWTTDTWFRFNVKHLNQNPGFISQEYTWYEMNFFTKWTSLPGSVEILCFDVPPVIQSRLQATISSQKHKMAVPDVYHWHTFIVQEIIYFYDSSIWALRDLIRNFEKVREPLIHAYNERYRITESGHRPDQCIGTQNQTSISYITPLGTQSILPRR